MGSAKGCWARGLTHAHDAGLVLAAAVMEASAMNAELGLPPPAFCSVV